MEGLSLGADVTKETVKTDMISDPFTKTVGWHLAPLPTVFMNTQ